MIKISMTLLGDETLTDVEKSKLHQNIVSDIESRPILIKNDHNTLLVAVRILLASTDRYGIHLLSKKYWEAYLLHRSEKWYDKGDLILLHFSENILNFSYFKAYDSEYIMPKIEFLSKLPYYLKAVGMVINRGTNHMENA